LGIKPLYVWEGRLGGVPVVAFASEIQALFAHPQIAPQADMLGVSAYLSNIRTVTGARTMFAGVRALLPGEVVQYDLRGDEPRAARCRRLRVAEWQRGDDLCQVLTESVTRHLRSDVPLCAMLSGGLDSSAICAIARPQLSELHTYCAGAPDAQSVDGVPQGDDLPAGVLVSEHLHTRHTIVSLDQAGFAAGWAEMVAKLGVPLSTPNEVAIYRMCREMRAHGRVVTLSGEGADELLGGYEGPMAAAAAFVATGAVGGGGFQLASNAWCPHDLKPVVLTEQAWRGAEADAWLKCWYEETFEHCMNESACGLGAHLRFHREVNLTGLLGRLDSASMLASVEGRTPFADVAVAAMAESLPMSQKYAPETPERTKVVLRRAMAGLLPESIVSRPKASFPLPFQIWMHDAAAVLDECGWIREVISPEALLLIRAQPAQNWRLAWPVINLALWGRRWWG
jgi:asparagine synthase (glutamine-hydrolysing)